MRVSDFHSPPEDPTIDTDTLRHQARALEAGLRAEVDVLLLASSAARRGSDGALLDYQSSAARVAALLLALGAELERTRRESPGALVRRLALVP